MQRVGKDNPQQTKEKEKKTREIHSLFISDSLVGVYPLFLSLIKQSKRTNWSHQIESNQTKSNQRKVIETNDLAVEIMTTQQLRQVFIKSWC